MAAARKARAFEAALKRRIMPPTDLDPKGEFRPDLDLEVWVRDTFIRESGKLYNEDHAHLGDMSLGFLWTNVPNARHQRGIVGQCELGKPQATQGKWKKARAEQQIIQWFGRVPDFIITLAATYVRTCDDTAFCALVEHELYHGGFELDDFGGPKFKKDGSLTPAIRGHDVEEHTGVVKRYGATSPQLKEMAEAILSGPELSQVRVSQACGTCLLKAV